MAANGPTRKHACLETPQPSEANSMTVAETCALESCSNPPVQDKEHCSRHYYLNKPRKQEVKA